MTFIVRTIVHPPERADDPLAAPDASRLKNSKTSRPFERMGQNMVADKPRAVPKVNVGFIVIWEADSRCPMTFKSKSVAN